MNKGTRILIITGIMASLFMVGATASIAARPNYRSEAIINACLDEASTSAFVCSSKELSNVVLQCSGEDGVYFFKYDDLDLDPAFDGDFVCQSLDENGVPLEPNGDTIQAVWVKSGSFKDPSPPDGPPSGFGMNMIFNPEFCVVECPEPGEKPPPPTSEGE